ncbi:related to kinesin light chain, partial [Serendipita indica DSM 11827]
MTVWDLIRAEFRDNSGISTVTLYGHDDDVRDKLYDPIEVETLPSFPTAFFITLHSSIKNWYSDWTVPDATTWLEVQLGRCRRLVDLAQSRKFLTMQCLHVAKAIQHMLVACGASYAQCSVFTFKGLFDHLEELFRDINEATGEPIHITELCQRLDLAYFTCCLDVPGSIDIRRSFIDYIKHGELDALQYNRLYVPHYGSQYERLKLSAQWDLEHPLLHNEALITIDPVLDDERWPSSEESSSQMSDEDSSATLNDTLASSAGFSRQSNATLTTAAAAATSDGRMEDLPMVSQRNSSLLSPEDVFRPSRLLLHKTSKPDFDSQCDHSSAIDSKSKLDDLGFLELAPGIDPYIDIIAIHGLGGHREVTWTTDNGILWLRDLLPSDLPRARILSYGYDADTQSSESLSQQRTDAPRRPIIFVVHNMGGIILKWALVICYNQSLASKGELRDILVSTHAIFFFGAAHSGLETTTLLETINRLTSMYMKATNFILKDLQFHSSELENIQSLYVAASEKISSIYFCEEYKTTYERKRRRLSVPLHPAVIAGNRNCITNVLYADHESLVRFPDATSENYQVVLHYLNDYCDSAPGVVMEKWLIEDNLRATEELTIWNVTLPKALPPMSMYYIDRPEIHSLITRILLLDGRPKRQPRCILHGLGGAGKTQLATNWIQEYKSRFTWVIFVDASSQTQIEADLQLAIRSLGPEYSHTTWEDAMAYLDGKGKGWLLFVDNADSPNLNLDPYLPTSIHGTILVTTRNYECIGYAPDGAVPVGGLQECEAVNLLHIVANVKPTSNGESLEIVRELGMLALAITQAGTYIRNTQRLSGYLDTFRKHRRRLLRKHPDTGSYYKLSTYATFDLSFIQLPTKTQEFMKLCAFLYHSFIPITLFEQSTESGFCTHTILDDCPPPESDKVFISKLQEILGTTWDEIAFQEIVDSALRASFIQVSTDGLFYTISPLLQMYIKDSLDGEEPQRYLRTVVQLLLGAIRPSEGSNIKLRQLLCHTNNIPWSLKSENVAHTLAFHELYNALCDWKVCREMLESALSQLHQTEGRSHESSIWLMGKIAIATWNCGRLEEAEKLQRDVLSLRRETNGSQHPGTLSAMSDLAIMLRDVGKLDEAEKVQREVLDMLIGLHGRRYQDTISAMGNLAITLRTRGQMDSAGEMQREVLALRHELLGQYHTDTLSAMSDLAMTLRTRGQLETAEAMQKVVVNLRLT